MRNSWREDSYAAFADGTFGNGGQNLYCSRRGVLQRIFHFDVNADGHTDLLFVNAQDMNERVPLDLYEEPFGECRCSTLPTQGALAGAVGDISGNGWDDLVVANQHNGVHGDLCSHVYFGGPDGLSEGRRLDLHAPNCRAAALGDFRGNGRMDVALATEGRLRIYPQRENGLDATWRIDIDLPVTHMAAADLDGDGCCDLVVRVRGGTPLILWGGPDGLDPARSTQVGSADSGSIDIPTTTAGRLRNRPDWGPRVVALDRRLHVYRHDGDDACLYPVGPGRRLDAPLRLYCPHSIAAFAGDFDGDGVDDLLLLAAREFGTGEHLADNSLILWGGPDGLTPQRATILPTVAARDAAVADFDGDGRHEIVIVQGATEKQLTTESLLLRIRGRDDLQRATFPSHDAVAAFALRAPQGGPPRLAVLNHEGGRVRGDVSAFLYWGGPDGFRPDRRLELPSWAAPDGVCCDFNDDGRTDILIANCAENAPHLDPGSFLFWQNADGFDPERRLVFPTIRAHGTAVGDFRREGCLDIVFGGFSNPELRIFRGGPDGFDTTRFERLWLDPDVEPYEPTRRIDPVENQRGIHYNQVRWLFACDFNRDGWLDLFVSQILGRHCFILWGGPDGFSTDRMQRLYADGVGCANAADLTGNGWPDLVLGAHNSRNSRTWEYESSLFVYWGGPDGFSEFRRTQLPVNTCNAISIADFDNNGLLDIFGCCYHGGRSRDVDSFIYWNRPGRGFSPADRTALPTHSACGSVAADFNGDGWVDLAVACHKTHGNHQGHSQVWWNGPEGFDPRRVDLLPTDGPHGMIAVDPGNVLDRGPEELYVSNAHRLPEEACITALRWEADCPPETWVRAQFRAAPSPDALQHSPWQGPGGGDDWFTCPGETGGLRRNGRWVQYRLALGARNGGNTPRVRVVEVEYETTPAQRAPR